jgi:hypothetical protein
MLSFSSSSFPASSKCAFLAAMAIKTIAAAAGAATGGKAAPKVKASRNKKAAPKAVKTAKAHPRAQSSYSYVGLTLAPQNPTGPLARGLPTRRLGVRYLNYRTGHSETQGSRKRTGNCEGPGLGTGSDTQRDLDRVTSRPCVPGAVPVTIHPETPLGTNRDTTYRRSRIVPVNTCGTLHT